MKRVLRFVWAVVPAAIVACGGDSDDTPCTQGDEGCACFPNDTCNDGLSCLSDLCVDANGGAGRSAGGEAGSAGNDGTDGGAGDSAGGAAGGTAGSDGNSSGSDGSTPVKLHGSLSVSGANLVDANGDRVKLEGMSSMWLNWDEVGYARSKKGLEWMRDNWKLRVFRAAMGVEPEGAYLDDPETATAAVDQIVRNAIETGVYVIIDWHDHEGLAHQTEAQDFFAEMSEKWGSYPNVLYEVFNEPLALDWETELKPYHESLVATIRKNDPDNIIILGTPNWDQDVDVAASSPLAGENLMYTLHFYSCSHQAPYRSKAMAARSLGLALFVTEWGATDADGGLDGVVCEAEARTWHDWLDETGISWTAWKLDGCSDSSCMFVDQTAPVDGGWTSEWLNGHAPIVIDEMTNDPPDSGSGGTGGTGGGAGGGTTGGTGGTSGTSGTERFPPDPAGCALTSCPACCETTGVYALDTFSYDATDQYVTAFTVTGGMASADFSFAASGEVGGIFFRFSSGQDIGSIGIDATASGGPLELALVAAGGEHGCKYAVIGSYLYLDSCWGYGAGPSGTYLADQIEVRVVSSSAGSASLSVRQLAYGP